MIQWANEHGNALKTVSIALVGDCGGKPASTKFGFQILTIKNSNSPANFTLLAQFDATDTRANLSKFLQPVIKQIQELIDEQNQQKFIRIAGDGGDWTFKLIIDWQVIYLIFPL